MNGIVFFLLGLVMRVLFALESAAHRLLHLLPGFGAKWREAKGGTGLKLEIGGGETPKLKGQGFKNLDLRDIKEVDIVANAWSIPSEYENQVNYIFSRHMLEHLANYELEKIFDNWQTALKDGGVIEVMVPNTLFAIAQLFSSRAGSRTNIKAQAAFNGWQRCEGQNYWDTHKQTFTPDGLLKKFRDHMNIQSYHFDRQRSRHIHLYMKVSKS